MYGYTYHDSFPEKINTRVLTALWAYWGLADGFMISVGHDSRNNDGHHPIGCESGGHNLV